MSDEKEWDAHPRDEDLPLQPWPPAAPPVPVTDDGGIQKAKELFDRTLPDADKEFFRAEVKRLSVPVNEPPEFGWLIEDRWIPGDSMYWDGRGFTPLHSEAVRFVRKADAEKVIASLAYPAALHAIEHQRACEGCGKPADTLDSEGVRLCRSCHADAYGSPLCNVEFAAGKVEPRMFCELPKGHTGKHDFTSRRTRDTEVRNGN